MKSTSKFFFYTTFLAFLSSLPFSSIGQTNYDDAPVYIEDNGFTFLPVLRLEAFHSTGSYGYYDFSYNSNSSYAHLTNGYKFSQLLGFEYRATEKWFLGINVRHQLSYFSTNLIKPRVHFTHRGKLFGLDLLKEVSAEYNFHFGALNIPDARFGFALAMHKAYDFGPFSLGAMVGIKPFINTSILGIYDHHFFDFLQFYSTFYCSWQKQWTLGLSYLNDQEYLVASATYDQDYNLVYPDRRLHRVSPILSLFVCYSLFGKPEYAAIPNLPLR